MRILFAVAALAAMIGFAQPAAARDWTLYGGLEAGYGWNTSDATVGAASPSVDSDGFTGGVFAGVGTHLSGPWSLGAEVDWKYADGDGSSALGATTYNIEQNWTASVRARLSYEITPATEVYGTAGASWADVDARIGAGPSDSATLTGWTVGVGVQHDYTEHFFVRAEYRYSDYDGDTFATGPASNADLSSHEGLIGVGWKFRT